MPKLTELYLANNNIGSLMGIEGLPSLKILHLRHNKIEKIEEEGLGELPSLEYLNLRTNKIADLENLFRLFTQFSTVKRVNFLNCPVEMGYSSMNIFMSDVLAKNPAITRFCKIDVLEKHKLEAVFLAKYKWNKAEEARKIKEEEDKAKEGQEEG